ncbi:MAG: hypothetical protein V8T91_11365 [Ruminococcus sp.]
MAKLNKKGISTLLVLLVVVSLLSLTMFSCTIRMAQKDSTYIDMGKATCYSWKHRQTMHRL